jgi:hypothetical protein
MTWLSFIFFSSSNPTQKKRKVSLTLLGFTHSGETQQKTEKRAEQQRGTSEIQQLLWLDVTRDKRIANPNGICEIIQRARRAGGFDKIDDMSQIHTNLVVAKACVEQ